MKKAIVVVGIPGSGKTTYCNNFIKNNDFVFIDEPKSEKEFQNIEKNLIIASPFFCSLKNRNEIKLHLEKYGYDVSFLFFEKNLEKAKINCDKRPNKKININFWFNYYEIDDNIEVIEIKNV